MSENLSIALSIIWYLGCSTLAGIAFMKIIEYSTRFIFYKWYHYLFALFAGMILFPLIFFLLLYLSVGLAELLF